MLELVLGADAQGFVVEGGCYIAINAPLISMP